MSADLWVNVIVALVSAFGGVGMKSLVDARQVKRKAAARLPLEIDALRRSRSVLAMNNEKLLAYAAHLYERSRLAGLNTATPPTLESDSWPPQWLTDTVK